MGEEETLEQVFYPINDHLGQTFMMLRADMWISHEQYTNPFGQTYAQYVDAGMGAGPTKQNRRFPGQYYDGETGLHYNWNRYYDPTTGSYTQSDPIGIDGGINTYLYAGANPVMNVDFSGLVDQNLITDSVKRYVIPIGNGKDGMHDVAIHSSGTGFGTEQYGGEKFTSEQLAKKIVTDPHYTPGLQIKLWSCQAARLNLAQDLANNISRLTGMPQTIFAPTGNVVFDGDPGPGNLGRVSGGRFVRIRSQ